MIRLVLKFRRALGDQGSAAPSLLADVLCARRWISSWSWVCSEAMDSQARISTPDAGTHPWRSLSTSSASSAPDALPLQQSAPNMHAHGVQTTMDSLMRRAMSSTHRFTDDYDKHHRVNTAIYSRSLQVIFPDGHSELLNRKDALKAAAEHKLDLVEFLGPEHGPAVAKITSYKSLRIQHSKQRQEEVRRLHEQAASTGKATERRGRQAGAQASGETQADADARSTAGAPVQAQAQPAREAPGRQQSGQKRKEQAGGKSGGKVKEVFFSPKIATHDIEVRMKKIRQWLASGHRVSLVREVDAKDSDQAAVLALDSLASQLADVGVSAGGKHKTATTVTLTLQPKTAAQQAATKKSKGSAEKAGRAEQMRKAVASHSSGI